MAVAVIRCVTLALHIMVKNIVWFVGKGFTFRMGSVCRVVLLVTILTVTRVYVSNVPLLAVLAMVIHPHNVFLAQIPLCCLVVGHVRVNAPLVLLVFRAIASTVLNVRLFLDAGFVPIQVFVMFVFPITLGNQIVSIIVHYLQH